VTIRRLLAADAAAFQELRLRALLNSPQSFTSSYEEEAHLSVAEVASRLEPTADRAVFGAYEADQLIGMAGLGREQMQKIRHKANVWGLYVGPESRGKGLGRRLLEAAIDFAAQAPGITQVCISVYSGNSVARSLYVSAGFVPYGIENAAMQVDGRFLDEEHMIRFLPAKIHP
jgi:RimJ/RimL family protein N-acetyltransferase